MRQIILVGLIAMLAACSKESDSSDNARGALQVNLSLGGVTSRAIDESIYDSDGKGYTLPFSAVNDLTVDLYESLSDAPIFTYQATLPQIETIKKLPVGAMANLFITDIPLNTKHVRVSINKSTAVNPDINHLQVTNFDKPLAPTMGREKVPYEGVTSSLTLFPGTELYRFTVKATVEVAPVLSRFEVKPGTIKIADPATAGYIFNWTTGAAGIAKIKGFTPPQITTAENSARENFKKTHGADASSTAVFAYRVRLVRQTVTSDINNLTLYEQSFYANYFKQQLQSTDLVKNTNDGVGAWWSNLSGGGTAEYVLDGKHSNMFTRVSAALPTNKVIAYHLFPQSVGDAATIEQVRTGMPHMILCFTDLKTNISRWLTIRAFRDITADKVITSFKPGFCYSLAYSDIVLTPWSLALEVRLTDNAKTADSDPIIEDFDQTSNVPEPDKIEFMIGLTVRAWRNKDIVVEI